MPSRVFGKVGSLLGSIVRSYYLKPFKRLPSKHPPYAASGGLVTWRDDFPLALGKADRSNSLSLSAIGSIGGMSSLPRAAHFVCSRSIVILLSQAVSVSSTIEFTPRLSGCGEAVPLLSTVPIGPYLKEFDVRVCYLNVSGPELRTLGGLCIDPPHSDSLKRFWNMHKLCAV